MKPLVGAAPIQQLPDVRLRDGKGLCAAFRALGCEDLRSAARYIWNLPYGRNSDRANYRLVLAEGKGTCSTKHALMTALGLELGVNLQLVLALYDMCEENTPGVGRVLDQYSLSSLPEAHCFLRYDGAMLDLTTPPLRTAVNRRFYEERNIEPEDIGTAKEIFHRQALSRWLPHQERPDLDLQRLWEIRNSCIAALSQPNGSGIHS
jgi:hypothetical protein